MKISFGPLLSLLIVAAATMVAGCPLPFDYNGKGATAHTTDPSSPDITEPVVVSYSEAGGPSGTVADGVPFVTGLTTTVTLSSANPNAVIFYTDDGTVTIDLGTAKKASGSIQFTITRTTSLQSLEIHALAIGPNMLPSQPFHATVNVSPYYSVTYNGNGNTIGAAPTDSNQYLAGASIVVAGPGTLVRSGYTFGGWNTLGDGMGTGHGAGTSMTMGAADVTLYAVWTLIPTYTVTYSGNGSTGGTVPTDGTHYVTGAAVTVANPGTLVNSGGFFVGWNTSATGSGTEYSPGNSLLISGNMTLYAMWVLVAGTTITSIPQNVTNVVIPEGVTDFGTAFRSHPQLVSVTIPSTVTAGVIVQAFIGCPQLATITSNSARYQVINGALVDTQNWILMKVPSKLNGTFDIPPGVVSIDPYAFDACTNLNGVNIPASLTTISGNGFSGLQSHINIVLPPTVVALADYAFIYSSVTTILIPATVATIGQSAMEGCTSLTAVFMQGPVPPALGSSAFSNSSPVVHVPDAATLALYLADPSWSTAGVAFSAP